MGEIWEKCGRNMREIWETHEKETCEEMEETWKMLT